MVKKLKWLSLCVALFMLITAASPVFAQSETDPLDEPAEVETTNSFLDHPIVKLIASFFADLFQLQVEEVPETGENGAEEPFVPATEPEGGTEEGGETIIEEEVTPEPVLTPEEQVAALHSEQELGFGEITKLLQIAAEAKIACTLEGVNCDVSLDGLLEEYKSGTGMGELFAAYGKPAILRVGQVKKAANTNTEKSNNGKAKGKNK